MVSKKLIVLILIKHYLPGYKSGGPVRTVANMVDRMRDEFDFKIVTLDRDSGDNQLYPNITVDAWNQVGKAQVFYCNPSRVSFSFLRRFLTETPYDILYLNSFFDPVFTIKPLLLRYMKSVPARPVVLAPRGEFSPGARNIKACKKRIYTACAKALGVYSDLVWHASTVHEAADIKRIMGRIASRVVTAVDMPPPPGATSEPRWRDKSAECLRVVFLSRISPKKNLDYALNVLKHVNASVSYHIYGPLEDRAYWDSCREIISSTPGNVAVEYKGETPHEKVCEVLSGYDLFFFPTRGENYGHVIHEALSAGLPLLISDQTPWRDLPGKRVGWDLPLDDPGAFARRIEETAGMDVEKHQKMRKCAREYGRKSQNDDAVLQANRHLFDNLK